MKLMIIKFWVTLTFYNSIIISSCIGGALPYLQSNSQQNQILNRSPSNLYGTPTIQPIIGQIQSQSLLNSVVTQRPPPPPPPPPPSQYSQSIQQNLIHQQQSSQQKSQQLILQSNNQQQQQQQQQQHSQQQQHEQLSINQQLPLILPPPPLPIIPNQRQQIQQRQQQQQQQTPQQFQNRQQLYLDIQKPQQKTQHNQQNILPQLLFQRSQDLTAPSENLFTSYQPLLQNMQQSQQQQQQQLQLQSQQQQQQQQLNHQQNIQVIQSPTAQQIQYNKPITSLPLIAPASLPPLQPGPINNRIFTTSGTSTIGDQKIAANHIVVENYSTQDSDSFLTGAKNSTLYAAQLLAKSLLEASHENDFNNNNNNNNNNNQQLNKTDLVVVKTQKKAYIIPMNLQGHRLNQTQAQELYQNRDKLPVAYTVNQFLFIIKPENVNFLNKLV